MKTGSDIEIDFFKAVKNTELAKQINGDVYRSDFRPRNSIKEDLIVRLTTVTSGQKQEGVVTLLVYVKDIDVRGESNKKRNSKRIELLEKYCIVAIGELTNMLTDYDNIHLQTGIQTYADTNEQHYISIRINFEYLNKKSYL